MEKFLKVILFIFLGLLLLFVYFNLIKDEKIVTRKYEYIGADKNYHYYWDNKEVKRVYYSTNVLVEDGVIKITEKEIIDNWKSSVVNYIAIISLIIFLITLIVIISKIIILALK